VDGIFLSFPFHVNTQRGIVHEISRKCEVNDCQFPIPLGMVYIFMMLLGIEGIPISQSLDTPRFTMSLKTAFAAAAVMKISGLKRFLSR
jgi:hypothetical protein